MLRSIKKAFEIIAVFYYRKMFLFKRLAVIWDIVIQQLLCRFTLISYQTRKKK